METLSIRKFADKTSGIRQTRFDPETGTKVLYNPATPGYDEEPWPLAGVKIEGDAPKEMNLSTALVSTGRLEKWITVEGERPVFRSGGPPNDPWKKEAAHIFSHLDALTIHTVNGDYRYEVIENPDKWPEEKLAGEPNEPGFGGEVRWYYHLKLAKAAG